MKKLADEYQNSTFLTNRFVFLVPLSFSFSFYFFFFFCFSTSFLFSLCCYCSCYILMLLLLLLLLLLLFLLSLHFFTLSLIPRPRFVRSNFNRATNDYKTQQILTPFDSSSRRKFNIDLLARKLFLYFFTALFYF